MSYLEFGSDIKIQGFKINSQEVDFNKLEETRNNIDKDSILFKSFPNSYMDEKFLYADYVSQLGTTAQSFSLYKKRPNDTIYRYVCTIENGNGNIFDYNILNNKGYTYLIDVLKSADTYTQYKVEEFQVEFDTWSICDIKKTDKENIYQKDGYVWSLGLNMDQENVKYNLGISNYNTLGQYNQTSQSEKRYDSGTFSGLLGQLSIDNLNSEYYTEREEWKKNGIWQIKDGSSENDKLIKWKEFIANGELKLLRDLKGNGWIVQIVDSPNYSIDNSSNLQQTRISFSWQEALDINKISIIGTDSN